jgi:plasmid stabilization system protein ParE
MSLRVVVTEEAEANISANAEWWAENRSVDQARRWKEEVRLQIVGLVESASRCAHSRENGRPRFKVELWDKPVGLGRGNSHRIVFTIHSETIFVLAVRSTGQDDLTPDDLPAILST